MAAFLRKNIKLWGHGRFILFLMGCLVFSVSGRIGEALTLEQHMVSAVSDHYYLTYFVIPMILFLYLLFIEDDSEIVLIRYKSYFSYFCQKWFVSGIIPLLTVVLQTAGIMVSSIGLRRGNIWTITGNSLNSELFIILSDFFDKPMSAFMAYTVFQFAGMWFLIGLCMWIAHFVTKEQTVRMMICLYVLSVLWIKISALHVFPLTGINHFIILHHNLDGIKRMATTAVTGFLLLITILYTVYRFWRSSLSVSLWKKRGMTAYYNQWLISKRNIIIVSTVVIGILLYKGFNSYGISSGEEWIFYLFSGHGTGYFHVLSFLEMLIMNGTPLYLLALFVEKAVSGQSIFISVRAMRRKNMMAAIMMTGNLFLLFYCMLWFIGGIVGTCLLGYGLNGRIFPVLFYIIALKFLDLSIQYMLMFMIYICSKQITAGFLALTALNALCIMPISFVSYWPFGLSSTSRVSLLYEGMGIPVYRAFVILSLYAVLLFLGHMRFGYRKI